MPAQQATSATLSSDKIWLFGYGSLIWKPNFKYDSVHTGYIKGMARYFWQGSTDHRGTTEKPGRVATLVDDPCGQVYGLGFEVSKEEADKTLTYLNDRESGYCLREVTFYHSNSDLGTQQVLVYMATPSNPFYLGDGPLDVVAEAIAWCEGKAGPNYEYLFNLAHMMRLLFPCQKDVHLFDLEERVKDMRSGHYVKPNEKR